MERFLTVKQLAAEYPCFSEASIRWLLFQNNEFRKKCVRRVGKKILFREKDVIEFINSQRE